jgi:epoxide hydrolase 4
VVTPARETVRANGQTFEVLTLGQGDRLALCLHGFPEVAESWSEQMLALTDAGYRVWAPNQRGYGRSSRPPAMQDYSIENLMLDVAGLIDASGAKEVTLIGHDWGALVAWCFATRRIRPLKALIIINVPHPVCFTRSLRRLGQMLRSWYVLAFQLPWLPEKLLSRRQAQAIEDSILRSCNAPELFPKHLLEATRANAASPGASKAMIDWYRAFLRGGGLARQLRQGFPVIQVPTLLVWGEQDKFLAKYTTEGTEDFVPQLTKVFLPGVSHWVQQEATSACNAAILSFLSGI